jgi:hypothetical protein
MNLKIFKQIGKGDVAAGRPTRQPLGSTAAWASNRRTSLAATCSAACAAAPPPPPCARRSRQGVRRLKPLPDLPLSSFFPCFGTKPPSASSSSHSPVHTKSGHPKHTTNTVAPSCSTTSPLQHHLGELPLSRPCPANSLHNTGVVSEDLTSILPPMNQPSPRNREHPVRGDRPWVHPRGAGGMGRSGRAPPRGLGPKATQQYS